MNSFPQTGHSTNSYSPTGSNSKASLHPGQQKVIESFCFLHVHASLKINITLNQLRDTLVNSNNYIDSVTLLIAIADSVFSFINIKS